MPLSRKYGYSRDEFLGDDGSRHPSPEDVAALTANVAATVGRNEAGVWRHRLKIGRGDPCRHLRQHLHARRPAGRADLGARSCRASWRPEQMAHEALERETLARPVERRAGPTVRACCSNPSRACSWSSRRSATTSSRSATPTWPPRRRPAPRSWGAICSTRCRCSPTMRPTSSCARRFSGVLASGEPESHGCAVFRAFADANGTGIRIPVLGDLERAGLGAGRERSGT